MDPEPLDQRLSRISTLWSLVGQAHEGSPETAKSAQQEVLERYGGAVRRYLQAAVRDADGAEELFQEFAYCFLHGDLRKADPEHGRFRDLVKGVLSYMIADHYKRQQRRPGPLLTDPAAANAELPSMLDTERAFVTSWRDELLARAWTALAEVERTTGKPYCTILRFRADHPELRSPQMAELLSAQLGKPLTAVGLRQTLHRARDTFADLLLGDVAASLADPTAEQIEQELCTLELLDYCRAALQRRQPSV
jgi:RNA polymerase sigma-70 factor (ECF subfamily)